LQFQKAIISNEIPESNSKNRTIAIPNLKLYNCNFEKQLFEMQILPKTRTIARGP
jgi:hypothetical protein